MSEPVIIFTLYIDHRTNKMSEYHDWYFKDQYGYRKDGGLHSYIPYDHMNTIFGRDTMRIHVMKDDVIDARLTLMKSFVN